MLEIIDLMADPDTCIITVGPDRTLRVARGGAMSWESACELRNFLVNDGGCRVWIEGFLHPTKGWRYRLVMRNPYGD